MVQKITIGDPLPPLTVASTTDPALALAQLQGRNLVLYFYPKDNTPGCTLESKAFAENYKKFQTLQTEIIGVSRDTLKSHEKFKAKHQLPFALISDTDSTLCTYFDVLRPKNLFGKILQGIQRSTFIFDKHGVLRVALRGVKAKGHVDEVLTTVRELTPTRR